MKNIKTNMLALIILVSAVVLCGCGDKGEIKGLIKDFQMSCNELDINGMLECLNPEVEETINSAFGLVGLFTDVSTEEMLDAISEFLVGDGQGGGIEFFQSIKIEADELEVEKNSALVNATVSYEISGEVSEEQVEITCNYTDVEEKWYISDWKFIN